jgi:hypothetical protein
MTVGHFLTFVTGIGIHAPLRLVAYDSNLEEQLVSVRISVGIALVSGMLLTLPAWTKEQRIKRSRLPPPVEKAVVAQNL